MDYDALHWWMWGDGQHCTMILNLTSLQDEMWRWIIMHNIGGCGEMDNIVLRSATSPSCKMRCGDGLQLVDVRRWTTLYYNPQRFCKMRCGDGLQCTTLVDVRTWTTLYYNQCRKPCMKFFWVRDLIMKRLSSVDWWMCGRGQHCITINV